MMKPKIIWKEYKMKKTKLKIISLIIIGSVILGNSNIYAKEKPDKPQKIVNNNTFTTINRIDNKLEDTAYCVRGEIQFIREENFTVGIYGKSNLRHGNNEVGINFVIGLGKSASRIKQEELENRIENLERLLKE